MTDLPPDVRAEEAAFLARDAEDTLLGLVCDKIDEANPDLSIEDCQRIAGGIVALVRERSALSDVYTLMHHATHFGTEVYVHSTEGRAIAEAEQLLAEFETDRHGEQYVERHDGGIWNVTYGEGGRIVVEKKTVDDV